MPDSEKIKADTVEHGHEHGTSLPENAPKHEHPQAPDSTTQVDAPSHQHNQHTNAAKGA